MITECYICKKVLYNDKWVFLGDYVEKRIRKTRKLMDGYHDLHSRNVSHGLCPVCTKVETDRINRELQELTEVVITVRG